MKKSFYTAVLAVAAGFVFAVTLCVRAIFGAQAVSAVSDGGMRIVLDAGHGGMDGGVSGKTTGVKESDLNLSITLYLADVLTDMGFEVTLTRKTEAGLYGTASKGFKRRDMEKRREIIRAAEPDLVVSIHQNLYPSGNTRGAQVFHKKSDKNGERFASNVQEKLNALYATEGVKARKYTAAEFFVLDCVSSPSILIECGFLSSAKDEALLITELWQKRIAENIAAGIAEYLGELSA